MPFAYLRKMRAEEELQRSRFSRRNPVGEAGSSSRAIKIGFLAILIVPVLLNLPWLHSALGPGGLPDLWVRPATTVAGAKAGGGVECFKVPGGAGFKFCEDLHRIPGAEKDTVLISCDANRDGWNTVMGPLAKPDARARLFTYEYPTSAFFSSTGERQAVPVELVNYLAEKQFHPLGFSIFRPKESGERKLFVINHAKIRSTIELFDLKPSQAGWEAHWLQTIVHPLVTHTPNSIHALSERSFVVTNDHLFARRPGPLQSHTFPLLSKLWFGSEEVQGWRKLVVDSAAKFLVNKKVAAGLAQVETLLGLGLGWVTFVELGGEEEGRVDAKVLVKGVPFANGIAISPDEKMLIVSATTYPGIWMYDILPPTSPKEEGFGWDSRINLRTKLHLPMRVDNLAFTSQPTSPNSSDVFNGHQLLATGHPAPLELICMARNSHKKTSASWSVAITPADKEEKEGEWEDKSAPLPAHHFVLSHNTDWRIRTLLQSKGEWVEMGKGEKVRVASSASSFYHPYSKGKKEEGGLLMVSGLYGEVTACKNVGL